MQLLKSSQALQPKLMFGFTKKKPSVTEFGGIRIPLLGDFYFETEAKAKAAKANRGKGPFPKPATGYKVEGDKMWVWLDDKKYELTQIKRA